MWDWITIKWMLFAEGVAACGLLYILSRPINRKLDLLVENLAKIVDFLNKK